MTGSSNKCVTPTKPFLKTDWLRRMKMPAGTTVLTFGLVCLCGAFLMAQEVSYSSQRNKYTIAKIAEIHPGEITADWLPSLINMEMPMPGSARYAMKLIKKQSAAKYPHKQAGVQSWEPFGYEPVIGRNFPITSMLILPNGDTLITLIPGGTPNDNTLAVSDSGIVLSAFNTRIFAYDTNRDTLVMPIYGLHAFSTQFTNNSKYDPKVLYDPIEDRFILVFLNGTQSTKSMIIVCFSTTNDPSDPWNMYALPGDPFNDSTWTDYPSIAITKEELFITGNQIYDTAPTWQAGFSESVIWQVEKRSGYEGDSTLTATLWSDIRFQDTLIRNLHPVQGGSWPGGPNLYLLSNRNFTILSDSIFLLEITGVQSDSATSLSIRLGKSNVPYGMPPDGRQNHVDPMATNDARVLGAFLENGEIQFVSVTLDTLSGFAAVYHGFINNLDATPVFKGRILADDSLDLGYPNIAYTGSHACSRQAVIGLDHTSPERNPGISALMYHSDDTYSKLISLKEGEGPVNKLTGYGYERWGDYFGIQRKYNEENTVWTAGFYARANGNYTWITKLTATVENPLSVSITQVNDMSAYHVNDGSLTVAVSDGLTPFDVQWDDPALQKGLLAVGLGKGLHTVTVKDGAGCVAKDSASIKEPLPKSNIFPNPVLDMATVYFELDNSAAVDVRLYDSKGALVQALFSDMAKTGSNIFSFSTSPLKSGTYIISVLSGDKTILSEKIIKP